MKKLFYTLLILITFSACSCLTEEEMKKREEQKAKGDFISKDDIPAGISTHEIGQHLYLVGYTGSSDGSIIIIHREDCPLHHE